MLARAYLLFAFLLAAPAWSQVQPEAEGGAPPAEDTQMMTPPPVSGMLFANTAGADVRHDFVSAAVTVNAAYMDNVLPGVVAQPINDTIFLILPEFTLDRSTNRQQISFKYSPDFSFYVPVSVQNKVGTGFTSTSVLDAVDHDASFLYQGRVSPHSTAYVQESFLKTSDVFNEDYPFAGGGITGTTEPAAPAVIAPFAEQLRNVADAGLSYQFAANAMVGVGGSYSNFDFSDPATTGLYDSNGGDISAFYSQRISRMQYAGFNYDYSRILAHPPGSEVATQVNGLLPFYTLYFNRAFSLSISAGAQQVSVGITHTPSFTSWSPAAVLSLGWQNERGDIAVSYLHTIIAGQGLLAAYLSNGVSATGGWKFTRTWIGGGAFSYTAISPVTSIPGLAIQGGGNSSALEASLKHLVGEQFTVAGGYDRLGETYGGIAAITANPNSNRFFVTATYEFRKALGR
jgi:hypothetical protein